MSQQNTITFNFYNFKKMKALKFKMALLVLMSTPFIYQKYTDQNNENASTENAAANSCSCYSPNNQLNAVTIYFNDDVPGDVATVGQSQLNCFAWQEFIALNWPVNTQKGFGEPFYTGPVQWETYMPSNVLFQKNGVAPPDWGTLVTDEYAKKFKTQRLLFNKNKTKLLTFTAKFDPNDTISDLSSHQAAPFNGPNWLGAQNSTNIWYEILINQDYYDFVVENGYYNAITQHDSVKAGVPIYFPEGQFRGNVGAIELKAAWMEVSNPKAPQWARYKLSIATVLDGVTKKLRTTTVALVGLHILHKTQSQPTWAWATFEQVDNAYSPADTSSHPFGYNFYNASCSPQNVTYKKANGQDTTVTVSCTPNTPPPYYLKNAGPRPIQITRSNAIDSIAARPINAMMQSNIRNFYPNSVWQYYQLVDVIWSATPAQRQPTTPQQSPISLTSAGMTSGTKIVANTSLESYVQTSKTCYQCHVFSTIAPYPGDSINDNVFGDMSFVIDNAQYPSTTTEKSVYRKKGKKK
jgi:hypothetical protein